MESAGRIFAKEFKYTDGTGLMISCVCVDSGAFTTEVYKFCKEREHRRIFAIKGKGGDRCLL